MSKRYRPARSIFLGVLQASSILLGLLLITERAQAQTCQYRVKFCNNCDTVTTIGTRKDRPCSIKFWIVNGAIFSQKVLKRPRGIYGTIGSTSGAYKPPPGFIGQDYFEVQVRYERSGTNYTTTLKTTVDVRE